MLSHKILKICYTKIVMQYIDWLRQFRVGPFSLFDFATAYIGIFLLTPILTKFTAMLHIYISKTQWLWLTLPIGIFVHLFIGKNTLLTTMFLDRHNYFLVKIIILFMLYMGLKDAIRYLYKKLFCNTYFK